MYVDTRKPPSIMTSTVSASTSNSIPKGAATTHRRFGPSSQQIIETDHIVNCDDQSNELRDKAFHAALDQIHVLPLNPVAA